jgi:hypothetical protein
MFDKGSSDGSHQIAAQKAELGLRVILFQGCHQIRGVQVSGGFSGYQVILHELKIEN